MGLQSTLSTGVSGLQANAIRLSVIGNNIANINTVGFKTGRVSFNEFLVQSISDARRPIEGSVGGVNPVAFGLGVGIASIDNIFTQGTLESTGVTTDMAIQGEGFFVVRDGQRSLYTRAGAFQFDGQGNLVQNGTGYVVQGRLANTGGVIPSGSPIKDLVIPLGLTTPAKFTTRIVFKDNLDADSGVLAKTLTIGVPFSIRATGEPATGVTDINALAQTINQLDESDRIRISGTNPDGTVVSSIFRYGQGTELLADGSSVARDGTTLASLVNVINNSFKGTTASIGSNGNIILVDESAGASQTSISLSFDEDAHVASVLGNTVQDKFLPEQSAQVDGATLNAFDPDTGVGQFQFTSDVQGAQFTRQLVIAVGGVDNGRDNVITIAADANGDGIYENITELANAINAGINNDLEIAGTVQAIVTSDNKVRFRTSSPSDFLRLRTVPNGDQTTIVDLGFSTSVEGLGVGEGGLNLSTLKSTSQFLLKLNEDPSQLVSITPRVYADIEDLVAGLNAAINSNSSLSGDVQAFVDFSQGAAAVGFSSTKPAAELQILRGSQPLPAGGVDIFDAIGLDDQNELALDGIPGNEENFNNISTNGNATSSVALSAFTLTQDGRDAGSHIASISVFDSFGETHNMIVSYTKSTQELPAEVQKLISTADPLMIASQDPSAGPNEIQPVDTSLVETQITDLWSIDNTDPENPIRGDFQPRLGDTIRITGSSPAGLPLSRTVIIEGGSDPTTVQDLLDEINILFRSSLQGGDGTGVTAAINSNGQIVMTDDNSGASLSSINITFATNPDNPPITLPQFPFDLADDFRVLQTGSNAITTDVPGQWGWTIRLTGNETSLTGNDGTLTFNPDGSLQGFSVRDRSSTFGFDPNNGADRMEVELDLGTIGGFDGLTQFRGPSTAIISSQDGFAAGKLSSLEVDDTGLFTGVFSNGVTKTLGKLVLASFNNSGGLIKNGNNNYLESANSGVALIGEAGTNIQGSISSGFLESSNVDLAAEFANIITTQRGFQANARIITSTDTLLQEVVNLAR
ncbi:MAG: flagellar hook-basal body complex protein [Candidatus Glassbacteria bacterium]|nr:flagellar hook-basal body complex protein [Candidatus Glassbacteria bacterium]